jgi:hypothetical protein
MSWGAVAIAGATVVSGVMSSKSASKQTKSANEASDKALAFEQQRYDDWTSVYGPLQDNLANYYGNVSPEYYASTGLEIFEQQFQQGQQRLAESLAQRGIDPSSGIAASLESQAQLGAAETRASIRKDAPRQAAEDQSRFLQIGLGQNPASSFSGALQQQAQQQQQQSAYANQAAGQAAAQIAPTIGRAIDAYNKPEAP